MRANWKMPKELRVHYDAELQKAREHLLFDQLMLCWRHLERAHIIGQPWAVEHTYSHWRMLKFAFYIKDWSEIIGQLPRLIVGGVKSYVGKIPTGNTGGANVPPLQPMEIPEDLKLIMKPFIKS
ncbi:MAG: DUF3703 domain-containing protein [Cyclobacteriaceae bacterium]|nr:DUF3703 domain-containing protein [Cyclobacteriaceae bacterium]